MTLHHRREITDMRFEYDHAPSGGTLDSSRADLERTDDSRSHRTDLPSEEAFRKSSSPNSTRPTPHVHYAQVDLRQEEQRPSARFFDDRSQRESPRSSVASTIESSDENEGPGAEPPQYDVARNVDDPSKPEAIPAAPSSFSKLFPSKRKLAVRHDDATLDGNMNLRVDTEVVIDGRRCDMTLFHLRMQDLRNREFSLRRYCRDSGREVCHSSVKEHKHLSENRPSFQRSLSNALSNMRPRSESKSLAFSELRRSDSGYGSLDSVDFDDDQRPRSAGEEPRNRPRSSPNAIQLEFSNYAHVQVKRIGNKATKGYAFQYWGVAYQWRRKKDRDLHEVFYCLTKTGNEEPLGFLRPVPRSAEEVEAEKRVGGWVPPCSLWIEDGNIVQAQKDVSDVIVAAALIALVDDSIRTHFIHRDSKASRVSLPRASSGPKNLLSGLLHRRGSSFGNDHRLPSTSRPSTSSRPSSGGVVEV